MENDKCGCEDTKTDKIVEDNLKEDNGCGCGEENLESADAGCGCGAVDYPDLSRIENPSKPKVIADEEFMQKFEDYANSLGINGIGYTLFTPDLLIHDKFIQYPNTIVLTMEMNKEIFETPPGADAKDLNDTAYVKLGIITTKLSDYLRENGFTTEIAHPYGGIVNFSPLAQKAGLGYIGKSGILVTPELGPGVKISAIFTSIANLPFSEVNEHSWIPEYCERCGKCIKACPEKALVETESCCGGPEVEFIQKQCIGCSQGCTYCIEACPFTEKGYEHVKEKFDKMNAKLKEKQAQKFDVNLWNHWAEQNSSIFEGLVNGATIAISMAENNERIVILQKGDNDLKVYIKEIQELKDPIADLMFIIDERDMGALLNDNNPTQLVNLLSSGKLGVYAFRDRLMLMDKGYTLFLNKLGLSFGGGGCCG